MQYRHPMQVFSFTRTTPSFVWNVAPTGQTWTEGGLAHWLHSFGTKKERRIDLSEAVAGDGSAFGSIVLTVVVPFFLLMYPSTPVPERRTAKNPLRKLLRPFTVPPPANGDNGIASRRTSRRARPGRSSARSSPSCPSRPCGGISRRTRGSAAWSASPRVERPCGAWGGGGACGT